MNEGEKIKAIQQEWKDQEAKVPMAASSASVVPKKDKKTLKEETSDLPKEYLQKVTLQAEDLSLSEVLKPIEGIVKCHVILGPGVEDKKVSIDLTDVMVVKALNTVLFPLGYSFKIKDDDLIILAKETRIYHIVLPPVTQSFNDLTSNESSVESAGQSNSSSTNTSSPSQQIKLGTKIVVSNESSGISFWDDIRENLKSLLSLEGKFSVNKPAGEVIVTDSPVSLERIDHYFEDMNYRVAQQIEVDVKVVEVSLDKENHFGVDWNALANNLKNFNSIGMATNFASENFTSGSLFKFNASGPKEGSGVSKSGIGLVIDALSKQGHVEVVSQPRVKILNNQVAVIQVGSTQSFVNNSTIQVTQTGTITSISTSQVQEGVTMRLLGNIVGDDIYLSVAPVITTIDKIRSITSGNTTIEAPQTTTKSINTLVKVKEGESVAIGGLITSNNQKNRQDVPVISKIPYLGKLFQYTEDINSKRELVIFITPKRG